MSEPTDRGNEEADDVIAAEYVLRLLPEDAHQRAEARIAVDGRFRARVAGWAEHFASLADTVAPVAPPAPVRRSLDRFATAEAARRPRPRPRPRGFGHALGWIAGGLVAAAASLVILSVALPRVEPPYGGPFYQTTLSGPGADLVVEALFDPRANLLSVERQTGEARADRVLQLWLIPEGAEAPVSLGVLPETRLSQTTLSPDLAAALPGGTLAISDEPPGGSPTGAPTGDVVATGRIGTI